MTGTELHAVRPAVPLPGVGASRGTPRIVLSGATGRLGRAFADLAVSRGWTIAGAIAGQRSLARGRTLSEFGVIGAAVDVEAASELPARLASGNLYVGCAPASTEVEHLREAARARLPAVLASTGFTVAQEHELETFAREIPILREANFSLGLYWLRTALARSRPWPPGFDRAVLEAHRRGKRDRPSGTARTLAEDLGAGPSTVPGSVPGGPEAEWTEVQSLRLGELPGVHQVWLASASELVRVEHLVLDRSAFAAGMAEAAQWLVAQGPDLAPGWYGLADALPPTQEAR